MGEIYRELCIRDKKVSGKMSINMKLDLIEFFLFFRRFIFKEDLASIPKARKQISRLYWFYRIMQVFSVMCMWHFLTLRYAPLRQLWINALRLLIHLARMLPFV